MSQEKKHTDKNHKKKKNKESESKKNLKAAVTKKLNLKKTCDHNDFWTLYKIINFHRASLGGLCGKCDKNIHLEYRAYDAVSKNLWLRTFSCILWMSPAFLIILLAAVLGPVFGVWIYGVAIFSVILFHFWAMYYIIRGGSIKIMKKK